MKGELGKKNRRLQHRSKKFWSVCVESLSQSHPPEESHIFTEVGLHSFYWLSKWLGVAWEVCFGTNMVVGPEGQQVGL